MKSRTSFVLLSTLWGALIYFAISLSLAIIEVNTGTHHPHGMPELMYIVLPGFFTPLGAILGLIFGLVEKQNRMKKVLLNLGISVGVAGLITAWLLFRWQ